jgi:hypothetical protein
MEIISAAAETPNLFTIPPARKPSDPHRSPSQFGHDFGQAPIRAGTPGALRHLQCVERGLRRYPLQAIISDLTAQSFQGRAPGFGILRKSFSPLQL